MSLYTDIFYCIHPFLSFLFTRTTWSQNQNEIYCYRVYKIINDELIISFINDPRYQKLFILFINYQNQFFFLYFTARKHATHIWLEVDGLHYRNDEEDSVISDLEMVWTQFLSSISSSYSDFLSVEQLGILLKRLAETGQ